MHNSRGEPADSRQLFGINELFGSKRYLLVQLGIKAVELIFGSFQSRKNAYFGYELIRVEGLVNVIVSADAVPLQAVVL